MNQKTTTPEERKQIKECLDKARKKRFDVWEHYQERISWTCNLCDKEIEASEGDLIFHLEDKHKIGVEK